MSPHLAETLQAPQSDKLFFAHLLAHGPSSRAAIAAAHNLSRPTASEAAGRLVQRGLIHALAKEAGASGKRGRVPELYEISHDVGATLTLLCEDNRMVGIIYDLRGQEIVLEERAIAWGEPAEVERLVKELLLHLVQQVDTKILAATVSVLAPVDPNTQQIRFFSPQNLGESADLLATAQQALGCPVHVDNHMAWSLKYEIHQGVAQKHESVLSVHLGAAIGATFALEKVIYRGASGFAGALSYVTDNGVFLRDTIQKLGVVDSSSLATRSLRLLDIPATVEKIMAAPDRGEAKEYLEIFSRHVANALMIVDPACLVLTGPMAAYPEFAQLIKEKIEQLLPWHTVEVLLSEDGAGAVRRGAALGATQLALTTLGLYLEQ